jgi:competence protein ComEA
MLGTRKTTSTKASDRLKHALDDWKLAPPPRDFVASPAKRRGLRSHSDEPELAKESVGSKVEPRFRMGNWDGRSIRPLFFIVGAILIVVIGLWFIGRPSELEPVVTGVESELVMDSENSVPEVTVHVAGSVKNPGLYRLPAGARIADAITAAGGVNKKSAANSVNLAREVVDGEQIMVGENSPGGAGSGISINSASVNELEDLPGVGPVIAARIVSYRETNGPFTSIDALGEVSGIGNSILDSVRDIATL